MKVVDVSFLTVVVNKEFSDNIVRSGCLLQVHDMYVTKELVLFCLRPVTCALLLNKHTK